MTAPLDLIPHRRLDLATVVLDGEAVVFDERDGMLHHLNRSATDVWRCCDGHATLRTIAERLAREHREEPVIVVEQVARLVSLLAPLLEP
jgi:hypothetical protein